MPLKTKAAWLPLWASIAKWSIWPTKKVIRGKLSLQWDLHLSQAAGTYSAPASQALCLISPNRLKGPRLTVRWANFKKSTVHSINGEWHKKIKTRHLGKLNVNLHKQIFYIISFSQYVFKRTHNTSFWVPLASIAEGGCQGRGTALIVQCSASIIDGWVDGDRPHAWGIAITVAVVIATTISRCPHVDAAFSSPALKQHCRCPGETNICFFP